MWGCCVRRSTHPFVHPCLCSNGGALCSSFPCAAALPLPSHPIPSPALFPCCHGLLSQRVPRAYRVAGIQKRMRLCGEIKHVVLLVRALSAPPRSALRACCVRVHAGVPAAFVRPSLALAGTTVIATKTIRTQRTSTRRR